MVDLHVERVSARYDTGRNVLRDITFSLCAGQAMLIHGQNGSGKSTLLRVLSGLLPVQTGKVSWRDRLAEDVPSGGPIHPWVGLMLQTNNIFPSLTVEENLGLATNDGKRGTHGAILEELPALEPFWRKRAGLLSGGERKLLGFAMATTTKAPLLLLDEPIAGLSASNTKAVLKMLVRRKSEGGAIIIVEHSTEALQNGLVDVHAEMLEGYLTVESRIEKAVIHTERKDVR